MKYIINSKYISFSSIFIANLIFVLMSNYITRKVLTLLTDNYSNALFFIIILTVILIFILSAVNLIGYMINYYFIKLLFYGTSFTKNIKRLNFICIMSISYVLSSILLFLFFNISKLFLQEEMLINIWPNMSNFLVVFFNILALLIFAIYVQDKLKSISIFKSILYCLFPYTIYNIFIFAVKFFIMKI